MFLCFECRPFSFRKTPTVGKRCRNKKTKLFQTAVQKYIRVKSDSRGFTLLESMIALGILLIGTVSALSILSEELRATATSKYLTAATNIARAKMEEIKSTPFENITSTFSNGDVESTSLPEGATWTVSYPDGMDANPLSVLLVIFWQENGKDKQVELATLVTSQ